MFSRAKKAKDTERPQKWDNEVCRQIEESERIDIAITNLGRIHSEGKSRSRSGHTNGYGIISYPNFFPVQLHFDESEEADGTFFYDLLQLTDSKAIPFLEVVLPVSNFQILWKCHLAAILSGGKTSQLRLWKVKGEGRMTEMDLLKGYSYESRYRITGLVAWEELLAKTLPHWALPLDHVDFSLANLPEHWSIIDDLLRK